MTSEAALTKLAYLLGLPDLTTKEVARRMSVSIRGELTEHSRTLFEHPKGSLSPKQASVTALGYAIATGDLDHVREVMRSEPEWLLNEPDYMGNTPLVSRRRLPISVRSRPVRQPPLSSLGSVFCRPGPMLT